MKKLVAIPALMLAFALSALFGVIVEVPDAHAITKLTDGNYTVEYTVKKPDDESVSIANDYFEKPAQVTLENGRATVQIQLNHSAWITLFQVPQGSTYADAKVISSDAAADTRVVRFEVEDLFTPPAVKMHVAVKSLGYDHDYTVRLVFDANKVQAAQPAATAAPAETAAPTASIGASNAPAPTASAGASSTPAPTASAGASSTPAPTASAGASNAPAPTASAGASSTLAPTASAGASNTAAPTASAGASNTAAPTASAGASNTPPALAAGGESEPGSGSLRYGIAIAIAIVLIAAVVTPLVLRRKR
ncbi:MAG: NEAr transporter [Paenibacillus sp.]|jgi:heme uptake protein IsdC|nr:NEAr transporter [Paenibacillus sp.]